ncbi:hypothetical protein AWB74_06012 [Caballeronia arvi]|uniref:Uncharacterized protein n=1 Tax=Caballeronia arvi TaxID=1777135 RepID=A0A158KM58_9BURK|nr:hypothetical protein [Caballeronia arvi]SAL81650.1 hypothetical protein AWB74_06012 [Caballeronia arvi]
MTAAVDFSPLVSVVVTGSIKIVASLTMALVAYLVVFLILKRRVDSRLANLAGSAISGFAGIDALYMFFVGH